MSRMPFTWAVDPEPRKSPLKSWLLLALAVAVLTFCATLALR